jgi:two-component system, cell cycle sensor histidine kinase and response regulator CckA
LTDSPIILVIDDESESLALMSGTLLAEGYQVRSANSGRLALASLEAGPPHLILSDIRMPDIDGFEVCRQLKASEKNRHVPLVFLSAAKDVEERVAGLALGAVDFITKPFRREELLARVKTHLELGQLRAELEKQVSQRTKELRATIEQLRESEERFRNMADTAPVMIWVSGPDKLCTFFNQGWLTFTGSTMDQAIGDGWSTRVHPDDRERCYANYSSAFDNRRAFQTDCHLLRADGEYRDVLATGAPRFEPGGVFAGFIGSCLDITEIKRGHQEHLARQKMETVGALAGGIAHDFNNLLGGMLAQSELAIAEVTRGSNPMEELGRIRDAAIRGAEIVRQLMVYAGEETEVLDLVDVSDIVDDMLELLRVSVSKRIAVETDLDRHHPTVRAIPAQIRQVVMNLFYNASEAIGDNAGAIRVSTRKVTVEPGSVSEGMAEGDYVQLEVSDTGRGMTQEVQARVFDPFFTTKTTGSHGLGLTGVRGIVQRLHGDIRVSSAPGEGAAFQVRLPSVAVPVQATVGPAAINLEGTSEFGHATILVVEDEAFLRGAVSKMLRRRGLSVIEASDGSFALDVLRTHKDHIDVMLLDINLPGAPSREVYEEAKRLRPDLAVIVTSANGQEMAAASFGVRIDRFLRKPFGIDDLVEVVRQVFDNHKRGVSPSPPCGNG